MHILTHLITEYQREHFVPTYLYIKQHRITKLKYFGKTIRKDPYKYKGSGTRWINHIKYHKNLVDTIWLKLFTDIDELVEYAVKFSIEHDIVNSHEWANLIEETGLIGITSAQASEYNKQLVLLNKHNFQNGETTRNIQLKLVETGVHHWKSTEYSNFCRNREKQKAADGVHISQILVGSNKHHFQSEEHKIKSAKRSSINNKKLSSRGIYLSVKHLYEQLNITKPKCLHMKSEEFLYSKQKELSSLLIKC